MEKLKELNSIFKSYPEIKLTYLFGSRVVSKESTLSDYDFAIYLDTKDKERIYEIKFELFERISLLLKTDKIDIVILNTVEAPELKYLIISKGKLIFQRAPFKVIIEPKILNEYFDFQKLLQRYGLTQA